jgi:hypothetical protein
MKYLSLLRTHATSSFDNLAQEEKRLFQDLAAMEERIASWSQKSNKSNEETSTASSKHPQIAPAAEDGSSLLKKSNAMDSQGVLPEVVEFQVTIGFRHMTCRSWLAKWIGAGLFGSIRGLLWRLG